MDGSLIPWPRLRAGLVGGLLVPGLLALAGDAHAYPLALPPAAVSVPPTVLPSVPVSAAVSISPVQQTGSPQPVDLAACRALALEKQPAIAAARASLSVAIARKQALDNLHVPTFLQRDLPKRRQQACLGITAAQAGVLQAEIDTTYAVQFAWISQLYARTQAALADDVVAQLEKLKGKTKGNGNGGGDKEAAPGRGDAGNEKDEKKAFSGRIDGLISLARGRQQEALVGVERAKSLLREAIGLEECPLLPRRSAASPAAMQGLPQASCALDVKQAVHLALTLRPEIIQATVGTEVTDLEIAAQCARRFSLSVWTFAAGSDIHANPLPTASFSPAYRPGAVGMEMPVTINGKRADRVEQAEIYHGRAQNVLEKTQGLIRLETEQAFLRYVEARERAARFEEGLARARESLENTDYPTTPRPLAQYLGVATLVTDLRLELNRARYELLVALIALERATAGGYCAGLDKAPIIGDSPTSEK